MTVSRRIAIAVAWLLLAGGFAACAPARIPLDAGLLAQLPSASAIHVVIYPSDPPPLMTAKAMAAGALFGAIGGGIAGVHAASVGKDLMEQHKVEALSTQLANALMEQLEATLPNLKLATETPASQELDDLKKTSLRPFVLDVRSGGLVMYHTSNLARYRFIYHARARLIDVEQGRIVWQGVCSQKGAEDPTGSPTLDELEASDGVAYRRLLGDATAACARDLRSQFRGSSI